MAYKYQKVDWKQYDNCRGSLDCEISDFFDELLSEDPDVHLRGFETLQQWPMESLSEIGRLDAIPDVIECLFEIAAKARDSARSDAIAVVTSLGDTVDEYSQFTDWHATEPAVFQMAVMEKILSGSEVVLGALTAQSPTDRISAARAMHLFPKSDVEKAILLQLESETDDAVFQSLLIAARSLKVDKAAPIAHKHLTDVDSMTRAYAAGVIAEVADSKSATEAAKVLAELAVPLQSAVSNEDSENLTVQSAAIQIIEEFDDGLLAIVVDHLIANLDRIAEEDLHSYLMQIARLIFPPWPFCDYSQGAVPENVRTLLDALVRNDRYWNSDTDANVFDRTSFFAEQYGLPDQRSKLADYVQ